MNTLEVLGRRGHTTISWDVDKPDEVAVARAEFERLKEAGFLLFALGPVDDFPASAGRVMAELVAAPAEHPATTPLTGTMAPVPKKKRDGTQTREFDPKKSTVAVRPMRGG